MDQRLVGWAKRSVPTGWTAVKPVGTLRFAHPTVAAKLAHATFREPTKSQVISWASLYVGWAKRSVPTGWTAVKPVGTLRFAHPTVAAKLAHATFREPTKSQVISWANLYVGWAKRSVPTGWTAVKPVGTLRFAHPTVAAKLAHATFREPTKSQVISWASLYVGWAKRSVPTGWTAVKPVGTLRFAHPTVAA